MPDGDFDLKSMESALKEFGVSLKQSTEELKKHGDTLQTELKNLGKVTDETKQQVDKAIVDVNAGKVRMQEIEKALARIQEDGGGEPRQPKSPGQEFADSDEYKQAAEMFRNGKKPPSVRQAIVTSLTTDAAGSAGAAVRPDRVAGILMPALQRMTIRDLLMPGSTTSNLIEYVREKGYTDNAQSQVNEGDTKGQSDIQLELKNAPVVTIAHFMIASAQILADAAQVRTVIDTRLRWGLRKEEENQLLNGDGTNATLDGLINNSTAFVDQNVASGTEQHIDVLREAMLQAALAEWPASGHILHPADWARIELLKDGENRYLWANPMRLATPTMWGLPVVETQSITETKFMTGAFTPAAQIFDRMGLTVEISTEDGENFRKNLVTIRAEERLTLVVYRPEALIYGDFGEAS